jgi:hypothetical protein
MKLLTRLHYKKCYYIRLECKWLSVPNTLAYYGVALIMAVKSFTMHTLGAN